jgi:osmotically-inducible protein OsmY
MPSTLRSSHIRPSAKQDTPSRRSTVPRPCDGIDTHARRLVEHHPLFRGSAETIQIEQRAGKLVLTGRLPSFYLKQQLQEAVRSIDGVAGIENHVDVVSCNNLSGK